MRRETVNRIRFVLEDLIPPLLRDSPLFHRTARLFWGDHITRLADFRARAPLLTAQEYQQLYARHPRVHEMTDNSVACIERIVADSIGSAICDVGCGTGYLLQQIQDAHPQISQTIGVDFVMNNPDAVTDFDFVAAKIEHLPFPTGAFSTVICTHVIEHILEYRRAIAELRRIAGLRLIIVVPREREYRYTFNPHFNFFPYTHSFLRAMYPLPENYVCTDIGRDIYYCETIPS